MEKSPNKEAAWPDLECGWPDAAPSSPSEAPSHPSYTSNSRQGSCAGHAQACRPRRAVATLRSRPSRPWGSGRSWGTSGEQHTATTKVMNAQGRRPSGQARSVKTWSALVECCIPFDSPSLPPSQRRGAPIEGADSAEIAWSHLGGCRSPSFPWEW